MEAEEADDEYIILIELITMMFDVTKFERECWDAIFASFQPWLLDCAVGENISNLYLP